MKTTRSVMAARLAPPLLVASSLRLTARGIASISPFVSEDEQEFDPSLLGRRRSAESTGLDC